MREVPYGSRSFVRDVVTGMSDGLTAPLAQLSFKAHSRLVCVGEVGEPPTINRRRFGLRKDSRLREFPDFSFRPRRLDCFSGNTVHETARATPDWSPCCSSREASIPKTRDDGAIRAEEPSAA